ncbi:MAG: C4-dicarboxylate transport system permease DctM subunit [Deferribacteraceae bacterium]|nr:C4-dicarboxylate transport system permease DctM subunit [Deferribacteraceae bacterium]
MVSYLVLFINFLFLGLFSFSLSSVFFVSIIILSIYLGFDSSQTLFIFNNNFTNLITTPEIISVPFFLLSSEILLNFGYTKKFKNAVFSAFGKNILSYVIYFLSICTVISSSVIFSKVLSRDFNTEEFNEQKNFVRGYFFLSVISYIAPISIPLIIFTSILGASLKKTILISFSYVLFLLICYYFLLFKKNFNPVINKNIRLYNILSVTIYCLLLYLLIFILSLPIDTISQILFLYSLLLIVFDRNFNVELTIISAKNAFIRTGIIVSVIYFINIFNFYSIFSGSTDALIENLALLVSESGFIIIFIYVISFLMMDLLDPLGIILLLFPIYNNLITTYQINKYAFLISFLSFVSMGLIGNIKELSGSVLRKKLSLKTFDINDIISLDFILLGALSFLIYFII